jgi:hypothetical protein
MTRKLILLLSIGASVAFADTVRLKNGSSVSGTFVGGDSRQVKILVNGDVQTFLISDTDGIDFGDSAAANTPPPAPAPPPQASNDQPPPPAPNPPGPQVPSGTQIVVRLIDDVDSERDQVGKNYRATLDNDIVVDGQTLVSRGADVTAKLVNAEESGKLGGRTVLTLDLVNLRINGNVIALDTSTVSQASGNRGRRAAATVGGVAALGAILGAIAGGGSGAAIGAASGAAVGTGATVMTKGERVRVPSETRLTFTLQQPIQL